jgi:hypothetical protein
MGRPTDDKDRQDRNSARSLPDEITARPNLSQNQTLSAFGVHGSLLDKGAHSRPPNEKLRRGCLRTQGVRGVLRTHHGLGAPTRLGTRLLLVESRVTPQNNAMLFLCKRRRGATANTLTVGQARAPCSPKKRSLHSATSYRADRVSGRSMCRVVAHLAVLTQPRTDERSEPAESCLTVCASFGRKWRPLRLSLRSMHHN